MSDQPSLTSYEIADHHLASASFLCPTLSTTIAATAAGYGGGWALLQTATDVFGWADFLLCHLGITLGVLLWTLLMLRRQCGGRDAVVLFLAQATLGPVGCAGAIIMQVMLLILRRRAKGFMEWYLSLFPDDQKSVGRSLYESLMSGREKDADNDSVTSFSDVLEVGTPAQKQTTLALLARNFRPDFAPALLRAMNDEDATVRVMAATAASRVESMFLDKALEQEKRLTENPDSYDVWLASARLYDDYAFIGILDEGRETENRNKAREAYNRCAEIQATEATPVIALGRLALRSGDHDTAITHFRAAHDLAPDRVDITVWLIEALFRTREYEEVRSLAHSLGHDLDEVKNLTEDVKRAVRLWRGDDAA